MTLIRFLAMLGAAPHTLLGLLLGFIGICTGAVPESVAASSSSMAAA